MHKFISIIVPVFRVEKYLRDCLNSLLIGQGDGYEVIAVNDCSPDGSASILHEYKQKYQNLKVIEFAQNRGVSAARNAGIDVADGEWMMFCDSDDVLRPGTIQVLRVKIAACNCDMISFELKRVNDVDEPIGKTVEGDEILHDMATAADATAFVCKNFPHRLWAWNKCFRRDLIGDLRFHDYQPCEDAVFVLDCLTRSRRVLELPNVCYKYLQHEGSCLKTVNFKRINGDINGMRELAEVLCQWRYFPQIRASVYSQLRDVFLRGVAANIVRCGEPMDVVRRLRGMYFAASKRVFVELPVSRRSERTWWRMLLALRSISTMNKFFWLRNRVARILRKVGL